MIELTTRQFQQLSFYRHLKNSGDFNGPGFEPTTSVMPMQCSLINSLSYEATLSHSVESL